MMISLLISLIILVILCSFVWWIVPQILPGPNAVRIAALIIPVIVLVWLSGGFGAYDAPWGFYGPRHRGLP